MDKTSTNPVAENPQQGLTKLPMKERLAKWKDQKGNVVATKEHTAKNALHPKPVNSAFKKPEVDLCPKKNVRSVLSSKVPANSLNPKPTTANANLTRTIERGKEQQAAHPPQEAEFSSSKMTATGTPQKLAGSKTFVFESPSSVTSSPRFGSATMYDLQEDLFRLLDAGPSEKENDPSGRNASKGHPKTVDVAMATSIQEKRIRELETELQCKRRAIESLVAQASTERSELISLHAGDKEAYERTIRDTENMITDLRTQLSSNRTQLLRVSEEHATSTLQITSLQWLVTEKESQIVTLTRRLHECFELRVPKLELDLAIRDRNKIAMELEETIVLLEECKSCLEEMELREARIEELELEFVRKEGIIDELEGRLALSTANAAKMVEDEARAADLQMAVEDLIKENDMLHAQNIELMAEQVRRAPQLESAETTAKLTDLPYQPTVNANTTEDASKRQSTTLPPKSYMPTPPRQHTITSRGVQTHIELGNLIEESQAVTDRYKAENCIMAQRMNQDRMKYEADIAKLKVEKAETDRTLESLVPETMQGLAPVAQKNKEMDEQLERLRKGQRRADELVEILHLEN